MSASHDFSRESRRHPPVIPSRKQASCNWSVAPGPFSPPCSPRTTTTHTLPLSLSPVLLLTCASLLSRPPGATSYRPSELCYITSLPPELIDTIISFLSLRDICAVSETCRALHAHATADYLWQKLVQSKVPGQTITSPHPCRTFRELYAAHDPRWFLTRYKIWFNGRDLTGRLILVRYDQARGRIEGYQMVATGSRASYRSWPADYQVVIHQFEPEVKLHMDKPTLVLPARTPANLKREAERRRRSIFLSSPDNQYHHQRRRAGGAPSRFGDEIFMDPSGTGDDDAIFCNFLHARPAVHEPSPAEWSEFPYGLVWPPPAVPARHRVRGVGQNHHDALERPLLRSDISDQAFHLRTWVELGNRRGGGGGRPRRGTDAEEEQQQQQQQQQHESDDMHLEAGGGGGSARGTASYQGGFGFRVIGEDVTTFATLDPKLYTPTPDKPWRGIWVGDYSGHGCEFLLINQPDDAVPFDEASVVPRPGETEEQFEKRKYDERVYRGRLEAIKLTGDPNVPRGEFTFVADDLGPAGFVAIVQEPPFAGTRMVKSKGHVARDGFRDGMSALGRSFGYMFLFFNTLLTRRCAADKYIESQLLLVSHNRLAQYWVGFGHISFFERVDIDRFLDPANDEPQH